MAPHYSQGIVPVVHGKGIGSDIEQSQQSPSADT